MEKSTIWKNSMNYGAIFGLVAIIYSIVLYVMDLTFKPALGYLGLVILIVGIYLGTLALRDKFENGQISYARALGSGVLISLFIGIISAFFTYILYSFIDPDLMEKSFQFMEEKMVEQGKLTEDQIETFVTRMRENASPMKSAIMTIPANTFFGFIFSLIIAAIIKKEPQPTV